MSRRIPLLTLVAASLFAVTACASPPMPVPGPTQTPDSSQSDDDWDGDPRCEAAYGDPHRTLEIDHAIRPEGWPQTPPFAVLCFLEPVTSVEEVGHYATDPGTKIDDVLWYYEHAFASGVHGYAPVPGSEKVLTGVLGDASYYMQADGFDRYTIRWAIDGQYSER
jgi:hypothetical protein